MYLALETGWFPVGGTTSLDYPHPRPFEKIADRAAHLVLPVIVLGTGGMASLMRLMRSQLLEIQSADYVRTARAKGVPEWLVVTKHMLRNALNPFVTLAGYELGTLLGGAALVEAVMNLQGLGTLMLDAVRSLDLYLVMGSVLMGSVLLLRRQPARRRGAHVGRSAHRFLASRGGALTMARRRARMSWPVKASVVDAGACSMLSALFAPFFAPYDYAEQNRGFPELPAVASAREPAVARGRARACSTRIRTCSLPARVAATPRARTKVAARVVHARHAPHDA